MSDLGAFPVTYTGFYDGECRAVRGVIPAEDKVTLYVNARPLISLMCTPTQLEDLALGFLFNEGLIEGMGDVAVIELCGGERCVDIWLEHEIERPLMRVITSGCTGGTTFEDAAGAQRGVVSDLRVTPQQVTTLMGRLSELSALYRRAGGVHGAALVEGQRVLCVMEDVGRHNTLDKIAGLCLRQARSLADCILLTTGRVSSEMVKKVARMGVPVVISSTSPTSLSVQLAQAWSVTLIGYARRRSFRVYSSEKRVDKADKVC